MITNKTRLNLVIGFPLRHSQSPVLHNFVYGRLNMDAIMLALPGPKIKPLMEIIKTFPVGLTCVTMPFKQAVIPYLDAIEKQAKAVGAVNTVINRDGRLSGYNTDVDGIAFALRDVVLKNKAVLLLGAGGAARAAAYFVTKQGGKILFLNRTKNKALALKKQFGGQVIGKNYLGSHPIDVIINATPIGMYPNVSQDPLDKKYLKRHQTVFDIVYNVGSTKLLKDAKSAGAKTIPGMEMFIGQGLKQIELYCGKKPDNKILQAVRKALTAQL